jgi:hypothetical protein
MTKERRLGIASWGCLLLGLLVWATFLGLNASFGLSSNPNEVMGAHGGILFVPFAAAIIMATAFSGVLLGKRAQLDMAVIANALNAVIVAGYFVLGSISQ